MGVCCNGHTESSRKTHGTTYPDCPLGKVSRDDVYKWTNSFKARRKINKLKRHPNYKE